jgi:hypothetical protein
MNDRFLVLSTLSVILRILGWIAVVGGIILFIAGLASRFGPDVGEALTGIVIVFWGFSAVVLGELIGVFFAIEENTRSAANNTHTIEKNTRRVVGQKEGWVRQE